MTALERRSAKPSQRALLLGQKRRVTLKMNTEEIRAYVQRTGIKDPKHNFTICFSDLNSIHDLFLSDPFEAIGLAFDFGRAKGYRLARSQKRKGAAV